MTALDDGLNTSAPIFLPPTIKADWLDLPPEYATYMTQDSIQQLGQQLGPQGVQVTQSFDDGLPDGVTMTNGNDASGSLTADLVGREGLAPIDLSMIWNAFNNSNGTGTTITVGWPTGGGVLNFLDYQLIAISVDNPDVAITETTVAATDRGGWELLGDVTDGTIRTLLFGRQHYPSAVLPSFTVSKSVNWVCGTGLIASAKTQSGSLIAVTPGRPESLPEGSVATTVHVAPAVNLEGKGWVIGVFTCPVAAAPINASGASVNITGSSGSTMVMSLRRTPFFNNPKNGVTIEAATTGSTAIVPMIAVPMVVRERPMLDAVGYFSPFNKISPLSGWERDTAPTTAAVNVVTPTGPVPTTVFTGVMADIPVSNRSATLQAVSSTRLKMDKSFTVPTVNGGREGATTDWYASYIASQGGQYFGPAPTRNTRFWAPLHGSLHPHMDGPTSYCTSYNYDLSRSAVGDAWAQRPKVVDGPFATAMYGQMTNDFVESNSIVTDPNWQTEPPGVANPLTYDLLSKLNGKGRLTFFIKADPNVATPAAMGALDPYLFRFTLYNLTPSGSSTNYIEFKIRGDRQYDHTLVNTASAVGGLTLPTDGAWYLIGFGWDYIAGTTVGKRNGFNWSTNAHSSSINDLPSSTRDLYSRGLFTNAFIQSRLPISDIDISFGPETYTGTPANDWSSWRRASSYLVPALPGQNATFRPTKIPLNAIAEPVPVQGWSKLQELAQSTLYSTRLNEEDNLEYVPLSYFGETAQMTVSTANILDTSLNASQVEFEADATKTRNIVTTEYQELRVDSSRSSVLEITSPISLPRGESFQTFALDTQIAETHGAAFWQSTIPDIQVLTGTQIDGGAAIQNEHVMTPNVFYDGASIGRRFSTAVKARIVSWDTSTVTIRFRNGFPIPIWLSNSGNQIPVLRILGYPIRRSDAYTTVRDPGSVGLRRERALTAGLPWIQDRDSAEMITAALVNQVARPRPQISITVMGDPRRRPGQLTKLIDATGTAVNGTWRIMACTHRQAGAMYVNDLELVIVGEVGVWDTSYWDYVVWGV